MKNFGDKPPAQQPRATTAADIGMVETMFSVSAEGDIEPTKVIVSTIGNNSHLSFDGFRERESSRNRLMFVLVVINAFEQKNPDLEVISYVPEIVAWGDVTETDIIGVWIHHKKKPKETPCTSAKDKKGGMEIIQQESHKPKQ